MPVSGYEKGKLMHIHIHHHYHYDDDLLQQIRDLIMPTLDDLKAKADTIIAKITSDTDLDNAVATVVNNQNATIADLKSQLAAAGTDPVKLQALSDTMDNILKLDTSNAAVISGAVTAGTPAAS